MDDEDDATTDGGDAAMAQDDPATGHVDQSRVDQSRQRQRPVAKTLVGGDNRGDNSAAGTGGEGLGPAAYADDNGAAEGKAVVLYEPGLVVRRALGSGGGDGGGLTTSGARGVPGLPAVPNFKRFRKTVHVVGGGGGGGVRGGVRAAQRRRVVVKYADEAYDALHQWEDANAAATHAAERAAAVVAEEMFAEERAHGTGRVADAAAGGGAGTGTGAGASRRGGGGGRGGKALAKPRVRASRAK